MSPLPPIRLSTIDEMLAEVDRWASRPNAPARLARDLAHCAQSIECAVNGFPVHRGWLVRRVAGPLVLRGFLKRGHMKHDVDAAIPGVPPVAHDITVTAAVQRLQGAVTSFRNAAELQPHFAYGVVDRASYERAQGMHVADHLSHLARAG
ncbi:MAG: DUF1569 domain-containing protein [Myxococcota bacterium]